MRPKPGPRWRTGEDPSIALHTDQYELGNLQGSIRSGAAERTAVFELFARRLPPDRRYGVFAGLGRILDYLQRFVFTEPQVGWLEEQGIADAATRERVLGRRFSGDLWAYREGEIYFPSSPVLTVRASFGEAVLLETLLLSVCNWDSGIASTAARMVTAAAGRPILEMGSRRTHEQAAVDAARAAYLCGFASTSNMEAGYRYGVPVRGTAAHSFTLAHASELEAFEAQVATQGPGTTLLVDTYDLEEGIRNAVRAAGPRLGGIRIDSGELLQIVPTARRLLRELGAGDARITLTGGLDEYAMEELSGGPVDGFGVGERLIGHPNPGFVYKLVAIADAPDGRLRPVAKRSAGKTNLPGRKWAYRAFDAEGFAAAEHLVLGEPPAQAPGEPLQVEFMRGGEIHCEHSLEEARAFHAATKARLRPGALSIQAGGPAIVAAPVAGESVSEGVGA
ncbi:MAG TPA: nicotinate phosphoribosyltransferase [Candidatus Dormibacteraeota bacterium]|jgi:nicotinate phosphoribosyltransferase|nr:nicotinate phosphoribosyltransferase [Candidatus Dormibacteraeota bacterium]